MGQRVKEETLLSLLAMPGHLQKTMIAMQIHPYASAEEIARLTKRARALESNYLNQLTTMGLLEKERRGRQVLFSNKGNHSQSNIFKDFMTLPGKWRRLVCEDLLTALQTRVSFFQHAK